jgi:aldehyde dehydrogenase (NAD+)
MATTETLKLESRAYINGLFVSSLTQPPDIISITSPSTGSIVGHVEAASSLDVDAAVSAATAAFKGPWSTFTEPNEQPAWPNSLTSSKPSYQK